MFALVELVELEESRRLEQEQARQLRGSTSSLTELPQFPQQQQQPHQQLHQNAYFVVDPSFAMATASQNSALLTHQEPLPEAQLSLQSVNPFPESVFSYTLFLASSLCIWLLYLLLPRGVRKQYFGANRKRYARRIDEKMPAAGYWMPVQSIKAQSTVGSSIVNSDIDAAGRQFSTPLSAGVRNHRGNNLSVPTTIHANDTFSKSNNTRLTTPSSQLSHLSSPPREGRYNKTPASASTMNNPPSPEHPALKKIPPNKIIAETMARLQGRGIRLVAHGVHCDPKRVWIRLNNEESNENGEPNEPSVAWQTEFPRRVPDQSGQVSIVLMRGSLHSISLPNVLYIDVGKKTHALQLTSPSVPDTVCMSLLTQNGSLDLQANSKLERDSLVSCFSMILDEIHKEDWRALYEASPEPSLVGSFASTYASGTPSHYHATPGSTMSKLQDKTMASTKSGGTVDRATPGGNDKMLQFL